MLWFIDLSVHDLKGFSWLFSYPIVIYLSFYCCGIYLNFAVLQCSSLYLGSQSSHRLAHGNNWAWKKARFWLHDLVAQAHDWIKLELLIHQGSSLFQVDGKSFLPFLKGSTSASHGHEFLRHYCGRDLHALRYVDSGEDGQSNSLKVSRDSSKPTTMFNHHKLTLLFYLILLPDRAPGF